MTRTPVLCGLGTWVPPTVVTNNDLAKRLDTSDEWIRTRTGIHQRHIVEPGSATSDLAVEAGTRALKSAGDTTVDTVVLATTTPDHPVPATAPAVAARLGLSGVAAFDLNAACSGFVYGLATAAALITASIADRVLFIGADASSTVVNQDDRNIAPIFGDGAGAVVLRAGTANELGALTAFDLGSDGDGAELIHHAAGGSRQRSTHRDPPENERYLAMNGNAVFTTAITKMTASSRAILRLSGRSTDEVDWLVAHQANVRILHAVAHQLDFPTDRLITNIDQVGNTTAASIPLALAHAVRTGSLHAGQLILLTAFGAGLTWGSTLLRWPTLTTD
ncbi:beta-ketoacyl-ACP synthase III [Nocardia brevicatena]|uniref:beta-ketoacyl-ACP synthase III n=1 Tax=Nocardia brevicatena TaxID=37327 RepID=UPI000319240B|nr:beta-ketoacyl-ACP synthase III [Nocardia brevicatena]